jgi:MSHA pilin protein MshC
VLTNTKGFTLVELIAVLLIVGVLGTVVTTRLIPSSSFELQASRDQLVAAFLSAQQLAMAQQDRVRILTSGATVDIRRDQNGDGSFANSESVSIDGVQYPLSVSGATTFSSTSFDFDRLGRTSSGFITLTLRSNNTVLTVNEAGYLEY